MGPPVGNDNATRGRIWRNAIRRALEKRSSSKDRKDAVDALAEVLLQKAEDGEGWALKELGDRLDGKPHQTIGGDPEGVEIPVSMIVKYVKPTG